MLKQFLLATGLLFNLGAAHAYQAEVNIGYEYSDIEDLSDLDTLFINGKYYLEPVTAENAPLAEAAFLSKASNLGMGYVNASGNIQEEVGYYPFDTIKLDLDLNVLGVSGEFFIPNSQFYVAGSLNRTKLSAKFAGYEESETNNGYAFELGYLPVNGLLLTAGLAKENFDPVQIATYGLTPNLLNAAAVDEDSAVSLRAKYVAQAGEFYTNFEGLAYFGDETTYRFGADLYLDPTLSIGVSIANSTAEDSETIFSVQAQKFFTPSIAVGVQYITLDGADSAGIHGTFRF